VTHLRALRLPPDRFVATLRTVWDAGDAVLPLPHDATDATIDRLLGALRPSSLTSLTGDRLQTVALAAAQPVDPRVAVVIATSGSTGEPKGVELSHAALTAATTASIARLGCRTGERWALHLPLHHVAGLQVVLRAWALGTEPMLAGTGGASSLAVEHLALVPTQLARLLDDGVDLSTCRSVLVGGGPAAPGLLERAERAGVPVVRSYGMTETSGGCVYDGAALDGVQVRLRADHRIQIRGPVLFDRYRGEPSGAALDVDGWFTTGDLGQLEQGRLTVTGRADDVIISGGENIPAEPVRQALLTHAGVEDAAVVGRPDPEWGEVVCAVVVAADPRDPPTLAALRAQVHAALPAAHAPRALLLVDALPRDAMGKVTRASIDAVPLD
jgi:o-succinylbenzoate---CoA ligase